MLEVIMSTTVHQLLTDAKRLVSRLCDHDNSADTLISQAQTLSNNMKVIKQYHEELEGLNALAHQRPRSALILNIQQENRHIRELQQENRELRAMLEEHQSAVELIMTKYRQQVYQLNQTQEAEKAWIQRDSSQELQKRNDKIEEMVAVMKKAIEIDDDNCLKEKEKLLRLVNENKLLRELLEITKSQKISHKLFKKINEEGVQTEL